MGQNAGIITHQNLERVVRVVIHVVWQLGRIDIPFIFEISKIYVDIRNTVFTGHLGKCLIHMRSRNRMTVDISR